MPLNIFQIDAFTDELFRGNPAAVVPLDTWLPDELLLAIAAENNLSETAFFLPAAPGSGADFHLRWFTPAAEVQLCGHATLAAAHVLLHHLGFAKGRVVFDSLSGPLTVEAGADGALTLDFPSIPFVPVEPVDGLAPALGGAPAALYAADTSPTGAAHRLLAVFETEAHVAALEPDFRALRPIEGGRCIVTAPADDAALDFVSRFFAPGVGIDEDPVTGSAHCLLAPYWAARLGKTSLRARQISRRGGSVGCEVVGERVRLTGRAATFLEGRITVPAASIP